MAATSALEVKLNDIFGKKAPQLPVAGKKGIVQYAPIISLVLGILTLLGVLGLWNAARAVSGIADYANSICATYGGSNCAVATSHLTLWVWISLIVLLVEGILYLVAYSGLKARSKQGWNYLYYGALINLAYAIVTLFSSYDVVGHFIGALIGSAIGFYFLFQIREYYLGKKVVEASAPTAPKDSIK